MKSVKKSKKELNEAIAQKMGQISVDDIDRDSIENLISHLTREITKPVPKVVDEDKAEKKRLQLEKMRQTRLENLERKKAEKEAEKMRQIEAKKLEIENRVRAEILKQKEEADRQKLELHRMKQEKKAMRLQKKMKEVIHESEDDDDTPVITPSKSKPKFTPDPQMTGPEPTIQLSRYEIMKALEGRRW